MSDTELEPTAEETTTSPPNRRRKRTIISECHPDIKSITNESESADNNQDPVPNGTNTETVDIERVSETDSEVGQDTCTIEECSNLDAEGSNESVSVDNIDSPSDSVVFTLESDSPDSSLDFTVTKEIKHETETNHDTGQNEASAIPNDIVYDETKPRRLPPKLKIGTNTDNSHAFSQLISPDEPGERFSPTRRRAKPTSYSPDNIQYLEEPALENKTVEVVKRAAHYDRSPETRRRKCSSPVQRLIVKNEQAAVAVAARGRERKSSSEDKLSTLNYPKGPNFNPPRQRKISSDARLEHRTVEEQGMVTPDATRKRKVSFDPSTLMNGNRVLPLKDGPKLSFQEEPEFYIVENYDVENGVENENGAGPKVSPPKIVYSYEDDEGFEPSDRDCSALEKSNSEASEEGEEGYASGTDNKAYVADDEASLPGVIPRKQRNNLDLPVEQPLRRISPVSSKNDLNSAAVITHTSETATLSKKASSASLPASFGRRSYSSDEISTPKSILKNRTVDGESMVSEDSIAGKTFKVRKDSIALLMDHNGQVAMQELRKEYAHHRWKCIGKDDVKRLWADRKNLLRKYKLHVLVLTLFLMTFAFVIVGLHFHSEHHKNAKTSQKIFFDAKTRVLSLSDHDATDTFTGKLGLDMPSWKHPTHCYSNFAQIYDKTCLKWKDNGRLELAYFLQNNTSCYNVTWYMNTGTTPYDCYSLGSGHWYGPVNTTESQWPLKSNRFSFAVNKAKQFGSGTFSTAVEYYWISSKGHAIIVDSDYPLEISMNVNGLNTFCLKGKKDGDFYYQSDVGLKHLHYTVCNGKNIVDTHRFIRTKFYPAVSNLPEKSFLEYPHWSSVWDSESFTINQTVVQKLATSVHDNNLNCSAIDIDGQWEAKFGDMTFNNVLFDNMTAIVAGVKKAGCNLALNVYPFFNFHSKNFQEGMSKQYFVRDIGESVPALLRWEHGVGAMLDVSNPDARDWFTAKIRRVASDYDIKSFRLAYGSLAWVPHKPVFQNRDTSPNKVKQMFSSMVSGLGNTVIQSTSQSQHITALLALPFNIVNGGNRKCIRNIIPDVFNLGLMGYPFIMSDGFSLDLKLKSDEYLPNRDLYIRWMQISAFMPAMRYTIKPWTYDQEVVEAAKNLSTFHSTNILNAIYSIKDKILAGEPIIKPLWWDQPNDSVTYTIDDQFMMADRYLVAPVLCEMDDQQRHLGSRRIYIPDGVWKDIGSQKIILGPRWIEDYKVAQFDIPYFERMAQFDN